MDEAKNVVVTLKVTATIWKYLCKKENFSEFIRNLIDREIAKEKQRDKNKRLDV